MEEDTKGLEILLSCSARRRHLEKNQTSRRTRRLEACALLRDV
jgi:hypothetical protein